ncbi:MAG: V-type ATP synthase subunit F [Candidatus Brocadiia bacterium]|nr:hypothetical protein [Planctomycetota bacterium]
MAETDKVVAIGPREEMKGLRTIGIELVPAERPEQMLETLDEQVKKPEVRLVVVSESVSEGSREELMNLRLETDTAILLIPSHRGSQGVTLDWIRQEMEQSIGVDVISEK